MSRYRFLPRSPLACGVLLAVYLLAAPAAAQADVPEWEHLGLFFGRTLTFYPGAAPNGSLDTLIASGVVLSEFGSHTNVVLRRGLSEAEWTNASPSGAHVASEAALSSGCITIGSNAGPRGIQRTCDGGRSWSERLWPDGDHIHVECLLFRPSDGTALGCIDDDLAISRDNGLTWDSLNATFPNVESRPHALIEHPSAAPDGGPRLIAGILGHGYATSDDGGLTWTPSSAWNPGQYLPDDLALDPFDGTTHDGRLYATANNGLAAGPREALLASDDGGETWTTLRHFVTGSAAVTVAANGDVWVGTNESARDVGAVWRSEDGGQTWMEVTSNIDTREPVLAIRQGGDGRIYMAGSGVWRTVEPVSVASAERPEAERLSLRVSPNPSRQRVTLALTGLASTRHSFVVVDSVGREIIRNELVSRSSWDVDVLGWAPGLYHARVEGIHPAVEPVSFTVVR